MRVLMLNDRIRFSCIPVAGIPLSHVPRGFLLERRTFLRSERAEDTAILGLVNAAIQDHAKFVPNA